MLPDSVQLLDEDERRKHATVLMIIAAADGELVREEISAIESCMGLMLIHPNVREDIRQCLTSPPELDDVISEMETATIRLALRDGAIVAAADGDYDEKELNILRMLAKSCGIDDERLKRLLDWVNDLWHLCANGREIIASPMLGDDKLIGTEKR
jgi:tellurite resistance protein